MAVCRPILDISLRLLFAGVHCSKSNAIIHDPWPFYETVVMARRRLGDTGRPHFDASRALGANRAISSAQPRMRDRRQYRRNIIIICDRHLIIIWQHQPHHLIMGMSMTRHCRGMARHYIYASYSAAVARRPGDLNGRGDGNVATKPVAAKAHHIASWCLRAARKLEWHAACRLSSKRNDWPAWRRELVEKPLLEAG